MLDVELSASIFMTAFSTPSTGSLYKHSLGSHFLSRLLCDLKQSLVGHSGSHLRHQHSESMTRSLWVWDQPVLQTALRTAWAINETFIEGKTNTNTHRQNTNLSNAWRSGKKQAFAALLNFNFPDWGHYFLVSLWVRHSKIQTCHKHYNPNCTTADVFVTRINVYALCPTKRPVICVCGGGVNMKVIEQKSLN